MNGLKNISRRGERMKSDYECTRCGWIDLRKYEPKEKPMKDKVIFETEEDCRVFFKLFFGLDDIGIYEEQRLMGMNDIIKRVKEKGYIKKSELETLVDEAEKQRECIDVNLVRSWCEATFQYIIKSDKAIHTMKSQLKEWGGER